MTGEHERLLKRARNARTYSRAVRERSAQLADLLADRQSRVRPTRRLRLLRGGLSKH